MGDSGTLLVQLTDLHIVEEGALLLDRVDTAAFAAAAAAAVNNLSPAADAVLLSGDLVNEGRPAQYEHLKRLLAPIEAPIYLMPGNHDERGALRSAFPDHAELGSGPTCDYTVDIGPLRLVALDTLVDGEPGGSLTSGQLAWLDARLAEQPDRPTIVAVHHPPFATGITWMDEMSMAPVAADALADVISRHPHVERVTAGHLHRSISRRWAGTIVATTPSTCHAVALALGNTGGSGITYEPPAMTLHWWTQATGLVTHQLPIGDHPTLELY